MKTTAAFALVGLALACADSVLAHHSGYMYQTTPIWISGAVIRFEPNRPHTIMTLEDRSEDGQVRLWAVEGPPQPAPGSAGGGEAPRVGDTIEVCAFPYRPAEEIARDGRIWGGNVAPRRSPPIRDGSSAQLVAGHVLVMPDGEMRSWEPHGLIGECIRSSNGERPPWIDFLNASTRARELWCEQRRYVPVRSNAPLRDLVEEINSLLDNPCP